MLIRGKMVFRFSCHFEKSLIRKLLNYPTSARDDTGRGFLFTPVENVVLYRSLFYLSCLITEKAAAIAARVFPAPDQPALRGSLAAVGAAAPTYFLLSVLVWRRRFPQA